MKEVENLIIDLFLVLFLLSSLMVVLEKDLIRALIFLALSSIFLILLLYLYRAPDVALTFSIVSTGASTVLFIAIIKKLERFGYDRERV
ncbi:MAG: Na(+)/H(+) antiporter subunit B [Candidatus Natronoplasma sp.]